MRGLGLTLFALLLMALPAQAHDSRPVSFTVLEVSPLNYQIDLVVPGSVPFNNLPEPALPEDCVPLGSGGYQPGIGKRVTRQTLHCEVSLAGRDVGLAFPDYNPSLTTLLRVTFLSGTHFTQVLGPNVAAWHIPAAESASGVSSQYFVLGTEHILSGYDHLLFVLCMLFIARTPRRIFWTVTGFTLAHSVTLALTALGLVGVSIPLVEMLIALSIVFVAAEIARNNRSSLTYAYPIVVTSLFGLLHGFGFASALSEIGLPQTQLPLALLMFNLGIEAGQILVVAFVLGLTWAALRFTSWPVLKAERVLSYGIGTIAAFWFVERLVRAMA
ncbi:MAG: HupE/UreJ family protein [Alphaproteobacteria bacterium]|nr:MAG: HupE/UreJ family protein [Alphaproteobacteria bacterium]